MNQLGRLEIVDLRTAWPNEASDFTPWLCEPSNLELLSEKIGIPLKFEDRERAVGSYSADILAKEADTDRWVLIENQITPTDHKHLGQLLTYAAGLDVRTIIWIAEDFREEHRAAIDFLNTATRDDFAFFGVQVRLYRIGQSPLAPDFDIVSKPNDWSKKARNVKVLAEEEENETQRRYRDYWQALIARSKGRYPALASRQPYRGNWQSIETIKGGNPRFSLNAAFPWDNNLRVELYIDGTQAKAAFHQLYEKKALIDEAVGETITWEELPGRQASRIALYMPGDERLGEQSTWEKQQEWIIRLAPKFVGIMRPLVASIEIPNDTGDQTRDGTVAA